MSHTNIVPIFLVDETNEIQKLKFISRTDLHRTHGFTYINLHEKEYSIVFFRNMNSAGYVIFHIEYIVEKIMDLDKDQVNELKSLKFTNDIMNKHFCKYMKTNVRSKRVHNISRFANG